MQAFLEYVVKGLVDRPDAVTVTPVEQSGQTLYELRLHPTDVGKIIGKQGRTARAMRTILSAASTKINKRSVLEIIE